MVGGVLLPSDLLGLAHTNVRPPPLVNASRAVLPDLGPTSNGWFKWNTTAAVPGGQTVKPGAILTLQANASRVQHTAQAGGLLELQIYAGADGDFDMVEDDGISYDYSGEAAGAASDEDNPMVRTTTWRWNDSDKTLTWSVRGGESLKSAHAYTHVLPVLFAKDGEAEHGQVVVLTESGGKIVF